MSADNEDKNGAYAASNDVPGAAGKLFVGQVPAVCTEDMLRPVFQPYGEIVEIKIMRDAPGGRSKGCAWVKYGTREQAQAAIDALHEQHTIPPQTNTLQVRFADDKTRTSGSTTAFVGNLPTNTAAETLRDYIQSILPTGVSIKDVNVPAGKLFGFVTFESAQDCSTAVAHIQGANPTLNGNSLRVQAARPRTATSNVHSQSAQQAAAAMYGGAGGFGGGGQQNGRGGAGGPPNFPVMDPSFFFGGGGRGGAPFPNYNPYAPYPPYAYGMPFAGPLGHQGGGGGGGRGRGRGGNGGGNNNYGGGSYGGGPYVGGGGGR
jgi:heterogeneous nuclear ribonucleoprotein A2/B1